MYKKILISLAIIIIYYIIEQSIYYIIIVKRKQKDNFKQSKTLLPSLYLIKNKKRFIFIKIISVILLISIISIPKDNKTFYDMNGNTYKKQSEIIFYDRNGEQYKISDNRNYLYNVSTNSITELNNVDSQGYVIDVYKNPVYVSNYAGISYYIINGVAEYYYYVDYIFWDADGNLYYKDINNEFLVSETQKYLKV